jgi:tubulin-folding cofactor B
MSRAVVNVFVVSPDTRSERRFDPHLTVEQLKVASIISHDSSSEY